MLFKVKVVTQAEYDAHMAELKAMGQVGQLDNTLNREPVYGPDLKMIPTSTGSN